jgi:class 3 adenylate cyclase
MFTDIEGSTGLLTRLGERYADVVSDHREIIRRQLAHHGGRELDTAGDGFFAAFSSPSSCLSAAMEMQRELSRGSWLNGEAVKVRIGLHTGEAQETPIGLVGIDVHKQRGSPPPAMVVKSSPPLRSSCSHAIRCPIVPG